MQYTLNFSKDDTDGGGPTNKVRLTWHANRRKQGKELPFQNAASFVTQLSILAYHRCGSVAIPNASIEEERTPNGSVVLIHRSQFTTLGFFTQSSLPISPKKKLLFAEISLSTSLHAPIGEASRFSIFRFCMYFLVSFDSALHFCVC